MERTFQYIITFDADFADLALEELRRWTRRRLSSATLRRA